MEAAIIVILFSHLYILVILFHYLMETAIVKKYCYLTLAFIYLYIRYTITHYIVA